MIKNAVLVSLYKLFVGVVVSEYKSFHQKTELLVL